MSAKSYISNPIHFINVSKILKNFSSKFFYNFYITDETTNEDPVIPNVYKKSTIAKNDFNIINASTRVPRYVELSWTTGDFSQDNKTTNDTTNTTSEVLKNKKPPHKIQDASIQENHKKIFTHDNLVSSKYTPYNFTSYDSFANAVEDVNKSVEGLPLSATGLSQATILENFISDLIKGYEESPEKPDVEKLRDEIKNSITAIEKFVDRPESVLGYKFFNEDNKKNKDNFAKLIEKNIKIYSQINNSYIADVFDMMQLPDGIVSQLNSRNFKIGLPGWDDVELLPVSIGPKVKEFPDATKKAEVTGYIIDRYEFVNDAYSRDKTIYIEDENTKSFIDFNVKYGTTYLYVMRAVTKIRMPSVLNSLGTINECTYYCAGKPITTTIDCVEDSPPPHPVELDFIWDYKNNQFFVKWQMPFNSQRDIKQFQIFRRKSINEPFELLEQQCFDFSATKATTGEIIDGNNLDMTKENLSFVKYVTIPTYNYLDPEFRINSETLTSSKYIYALASVDAHGFISNYSAQYEISFDFFKNQLIKRMISEPGAPRPYPNLLLTADLFKDVIQVSGMSSQKLKIYFMPEYFKITYNQDRGLKKIVYTKQDGGQVDCYYKLQFINVQNQKSDQLKIVIDDPQGLTR